VFVVVVSAILYYKKEVTTMAAREEATELAKSKRVRDTSETDNRNNAGSNVVVGDERKNEQSYLLLSTTYGLNSSHTKKIQVGLRANDNGFEPVVKLTGNYVDGICFDVDTWRQFQSNIKHVILYLSNENQKAKPDPITVNNIYITFTSAYGTKAVMLTYKENANQPGLDKEVEESQPTKKRRTYAVAVVMQKATILGLENIVKCINAHLTQLISIVDTVYTCDRLLIMEIELKLPPYIDLTYLTPEIIKLTIKSNYREIEQALQKQIQDLTFLEVYFNIVFEELLALRFNDIVRAILLKHES